MASPTNSPRVLIPTNAGELHVQFEWTLSSNDNAQRWNIDPWVVAYDANLRALSGLLVRTSSPRSKDGAIVLDAQKRAAVLCLDDLPSSAQGVALVATGYRGGRLGLDFSQVSDMSVTVSAANGREIGYHKLLKATGRRAGFGSIKRVDTTSWMFHGGDTPLAL